MSFFDEEDDFDNIVRNFLGETGVRRKQRVDDDEFISGEDEERKIDLIESDDKFFIVFELPGYEKEDVNLEIKGTKLVVNAKKKPSEKMEDYMARRLSQGIKISKTLPQFIKTKNYDHTFSNGILEVGFKK